MIAVGIGWYIKLNKLTMASRFERVLLKTDILLNEHTTEKEVSQRSNIAKDMKVNLVGNFKEHVITVKRKDTLLEIVQNEAIIQNVMITQGKVKDLLGVLRRKMSKMKKRYSHLAMKIDVNGSSIRVPPSI